MFNALHHFYGWDIRSCKLQYLFTECMPPFIDCIDIHRLLPVAQQNGKKRSICIHLLFPCSITQLLPCHPHFNIGRKTGYRKVM